jgi:PRTRC genetic system protein C
MQVNAMPRRFYYLGLELADLNPAFTPEQIRDAYCTLYPEITTAAIEGPEALDGALKFTFTRALGTKG